MRIIRSAGMLLVFVIAAIPVANFYQSPTLAYILPYNGIALLILGVALAGLAQDGELSCYLHDGFWQPMDTLRDKRLLEELWASGAAPWVRAAAPKAR